jgi:hypothetical protein
MTIETNGIKFEPLSWIFGCDGMWGHIFFLVPKGTFHQGANNGAYALDDFPPSIISQFKDFPSVDEWDKYQLVHVATPCMSIGKDDTGDNCEKYKLEDILRAAANFIALNL